MTFTNNQHHKYYPIQPSVIALCADHPMFQKNRVFDPNQNKDSTDTKWAEKLKKISNPKFNVVTGDIAISNIKKGTWNPKNIFTIQLLDAKDGKELINLGTIPFLVIGAESPLYAYEFYKNLKKITLPFHYRFLFSGLYKKLNVKSKFNNHLHFPSFNNSDIVSQKNWKGKNLLIMVADNKFYKKNFRFPPLYLSEHFDWLKDKFKILKSPIRKLAIKHQLVTKRLCAIEYFGSQNQLTLYGNNWDKLDNLPKDWKLKMTKVVKSLNIKPLKRSDKIKILSNYKFAICFENTSFPGYITEKIIDCFTAKTIPIYLGAPDITTFIPKNTFIDMRNFKNFEELNNYIINLPAKKSLQVISNGQKFLKSQNGTQYNQDYFAKLIYRFVIDTQNNHQLFYSQFNEDKLLWKVFKGKKKGTCIEVGSYNGLDTSNSLFFEKVGWQCILIEPLKEMCDYTKQFRNSTVINAAAVSSKSQKYIHLNVVKNAQTLSFTQTNKSHLQRIKSEGGKIVKTLVPAITLDKVISKFNLKKIDFITVDTEGSELEVLKGLNLNNIKPRFLIVENNYKTDNHIKNYLKKYSYIHVKTTGCNNWYAQHKDIKYFIKDILTINYAKYKNLIIKNA